MATGNVNVAATDFCLAAVGKPHLWKELEKKTLIHKKKGRGRVERIEQPVGCVALIYVTFGKESFRISSNILNNGSYQLFLPKAIAKEIGIRSVPKIAPKPPSKAATPEPIQTSIRLPPPHCIICRQPSEDGQLLSNGKNYHPDCYRMLIDERNAVESNYYLLHQHYFSTLLGSMARLFQTGSFDQYVDTRGELNNLKAQTKRIWDFWPNYPPDWEERRSNAIEASRSCENCGEDGSLHVHHIIPLSKGGSNQAGNLSVLCESCHSGEHGGKSFKYRSSDGPTRHARTTQLIQQAILEQRDIVFTYQKWEEPDERRTITPSGFETLQHQRQVGSTFCVTGFCHTRNAERRFKIKNIYRLRIV